MSDYIISANLDEIAPNVLIPGDPLRAKFIAENYLDNVFCYNKIRGMYGFTGTYQGKRVSIQATGMGIPSMSIYVNLLIEKYNVKNILRIGTCGAMQGHLKLKDVVIANAASTDSHINRIRFSGMDFAPVANFELLNKAVTTANGLGISVKIGNVLTTDSFFSDDKDGWKHWANYGLLVEDMETAGLYTVAAKHGVSALAILTVSDILSTGEACSAEERQSNCIEMIKIALETATNL